MRDFQLNPNFRTNPSGASTDGSCHYRKSHNLYGRFVGAFNQAEARRREEPRHRLQLAPRRGD